LKRHAGIVVPNPPIPGHRHCLEPVQPFRRTKEVLGSLGQTGLGAATAMMSQVESPQLVVGDERLAVLRLDTPEVVTTWQDEEISGEAIPTEV
jgi:hypothetical protein